MRVDSYKSVRRFFSVARLLSEERNAKLQEALQDVQSAHIREVDEMNEQLQRQRERADELVQLVSIPGDLGRLFYWLALRFPPSSLCCWDQTVFFFSFSLFLIFFLFTDSLSLLLRFPQLNEAEKKLGLTTLEMKTQERKLTEDKNKSEDERKKLQIEVSSARNASLAWAWPYDDLKTLRTFHSWKVKNGGGGGGGGYWWRSHFSRNEPNIFMYVLSSMRKIWKWL